MCACTMYHALDGTQIAVISAPVVYMCTYISSDQVEDGGLVGWRMGAL